MCFMLCSLVYYYIKLRYILLLVHYSFIVKLVRFYTPA